MKTSAGKIAFIALALSLFLSAPGGLFGQGFTRDLFLAEKRFYGEDVLALQRKLLSLGFTVVGEADGWFGPNTETAVKKLQGWLGFPADGKVTKAVWNALFFPRLEARYFRLIREANAVRTEKLRKEVKELMGRSPEGGEAEVYLSGEEPVCAAIRLYGEMSQVRYDVYRFEDDSSLVLETWARYPETFDLEHATYEYTGYFNSRAASYRVKNGVPVPTAFDEVKAVEMMDEALGLLERPDIGD